MILSTAAVVAAAVLVRQTAAKGVTRFRQGKEGNSCKAVWVGTVKIPKQ